MEGLIFDIQRFSLHDGPGIRTTVFMKGCPLRCDWCANPESQVPVPNLMVRDITCQRCGACVSACPREAILLDEGGRRIDWERCDQCLRCAAVCLSQSLRVCGRSVKSREVLEEVLSDRVFYKHSGGGVTISGGEPLSQPAFVADLLGLCKSEGVHTVLDTSGCGPWEVLASLLDSVDLLLFDVKHTDSDAHRLATGVGNDEILGNLMRASSRTRVWLRVPLVPGFNDDAGNIERLVSLARSTRAEKVSLLPYHEGGKSKCEQLGRAYRHSGSAMPTQTRLLAVKEFLEHQGLCVSIGS